MKDYAEIAARNRAAKLEQLASLAGIKHEAASKANGLYDALRDAKEAKKAGAMISRMSYVKGFFPTPKALVGRIIDEAAIREGMRVLEPSAGSGNIAKAAREITQHVHCVECIYDLAEHLRKLGLNCECRDFLTMAPDPIYDAVIMNPPFERGIDRAHVLHAFEFVKPGGRLAAIVCSTTGSKLEQWAQDNGGFVEPLPAGSFSRSERPTGVNTALIIVDKP